MTQKKSYDIIGDIHGDADRLVALLQKLEYKLSQGAWVHPERQVIFVGDFIDRGLQQWETCTIVRRMINAGSALAVMGNHEFNAIAWYMRDENDTTKHLRPHTQKNRAQHQDFLTEVENTDKHPELIDWFLTLPLWLELDGIRVVHACWHPSYMEQIEGLLLPDRTLNKALMSHATDPNHILYHGVEALLKGLEIKLPEGSTFHDKSGHIRQQVRVRWWDGDAVTFKNAALLDEKQRAELPDFGIPAESRIGYPDFKPVFIGHYSILGQPTVLSKKVACVDYYNKENNPMVAYRWDGETELQDSKFVMV